MITPRRRLRWISSAFVALIVGCSADSTDVTQPEPPPQEGPPLTSGTVTVNRTSALLTAIGQSQQLSAQTRDSSGATANAAVTWTSSAPTQVAVDATGRVTARAIGSAMIFATSGTVKSRPIFVVVAEPKPGALLVNDAQVLGITPPTGLAQGQPPGIGTTYEVRLGGVVPPPVSGTVVLAAENATVAGKVVSSRSESGALVVTLALAPLRDLFTRYDINFKVDLSAFPAVLDLTSPDSPASSASSVARSGMQPAQPLADFIQPFQALSCEAQLAPVLLDRKFQFTQTADLQLDVVDSPGFSRRAMVGSLKTVGVASVKLNAGFKFSGKCEAQVLIRIPIGGPMALGIMPGVRIGVGAKLEGQTVVTGGELSLNLEIGTQLTVGWECGGATPDCRALESLTPTRKVEPKVEIFSPVTGIRFELQGQLYAFVGLDAVFFTAFTAGILEARVGLVQSADLGFEEDQALNPNYASKYDLKLEAVVEPGPALQFVIDLIYGGLVTFQGKTSIALSESPKGTLTASKPVVPPSGVSVDLRVDLTNTDYLGIGYNVKDVVLWSKKPNADNWTHFKTITPSASNQTSFTYTWQPTLDDLGTTEFAAFVYTETGFFLVPGLEVAPNSITKVLVSCFSAPRTTGGVAAASTCADTWQGTATFFQPGMIQIDAAVTWTRDPESVDPSLINYVASGVATVKWIDYANRGCTVSQTVFPITSTGGLTVEYSDDPPSFGLLATVLLLVDVSCDGATIQVPHAGLWVSGSGRVSGNGTLIQGRNDVGNGIYWSWSFARPASR